MATSSPARSRKEKASVPVAQPSLFGTAPGAALGFSLQYNRLTGLLLKAQEGSHCSLEVLDDVSEETSEGAITLVQTKSALTGSPVADRAEGLWKTLHNWLKLIDQGHIDPTKTAFELYVSGQNSGEIVRRFHQASTFDEAFQALAVAREALWGKAPEYSLRKQVAEGIAPYVNYVFGAGEAQTVELIKNFRLECGMGSQRTELDKVLSSHAIPKTMRQGMVEYLIGWVKSQVDALLEQGLPATISKDAFAAKYLAHFRLMDQSLMLYSRCPEPSDEERKARIEKSDPFIRQLDLIGVGYDRKLEAVSDFMRASTDRTKWAEEGDVDEEAFEDLDRVLKRAWSNKSETNSIMNSMRSPEDRGKLLYSECSQFQTTVMNLQPPDHFVPGCFHLLADQKALGWHPDYKNLLK